MIRVQLNDRIAVDVEGTDDPVIAAQQARSYFRQNFPQEFEVWRQSELGLGSSFSRGASAGIDQFQGALFSAAEGLGQLTNLPTLERFGREGRIRNEVSAEASFPSDLRSTFLGAQGVGDVGRAATEAVAGSLPSTAVGIGGALAGAAAGAPLGPAGVIGGGLIGGAVASIPQLFGSNIQRQVEQQVAAGVPADQARAPAPGTALAAAAPQALLEAIPEVASLGAARLLRRPATEAAQGFFQRAGRGAVAGGATEAPTEAIQTGIERAQAGLPVTGPEAEREMLEAALQGLAAGTVTGGATRGFLGAPPAPPPTPVPEPSAPEAATPAQPAAPSYFAPAAVPERPAPFDAPDAAEAFVAENPQFAPPPAITTPEARTRWINDARLNAYQSEIGVVRQQTISNFAASQPETFLANLVQAATQGNLGDLNRFSINDVTRAALRSSGIDPGRLTREERQFVRQQLDNLASAGFLAKPAATSYSVSFGPRPSPATEAAPTTETPVTRREREAAQQDVLRLNEAIESGTLDQIDPFTARRLGAETPPRPAPAEASIPAPPEQIAPQPGEAIWQGPDADIPVQVLPEAPQQAEDGRLYQRVSYEGRDSYVPADQLRPASPAAAPAAPATTQRPIPTSRTTVEVNGQRRQTTPEDLAQAVEDTQAERPVPAAVVPPTPQAEQLANAVATAYPDPGVGQPTATFEEAIFSTPETATIKQQQKLLDSQIADGFRPGGIRRWFSSPITGLGRQPQFRAVAAVADRLFVRQQSAITFLNNQYQALGTLSADSQIRTMLALQEARSKQQMWDRTAFTAEENAAMDATLRMGQRGLDYLLDAYVTDYFNPAEAKTDADRARLEAFQRSKGDRLITDMPPEEVRAASLAGFAEMQRLNALRDPFFFPQISQGTHFVAAYERQPNGKEKLVRIYFYDPIDRGDLKSKAKKLRYKFGIERDFEAISIENLRREFPDTTRFRIMTKGARAENNERAASLKKDGEFINRYLEQLASVSGPEAKQIIDRMSKEIDKAQMNRFFRPNNDLLRAVTPENAADYARNALPNYYLALAKIQARRHVEKDFNRATKDLSFEERNYWNDYFNYNTTPTEAFGTGRALAFFWYLGFNFSTAVIQFTQNLVLGARLLRDGGGLNATRFYLTAARDVYFSKDILKTVRGELNFSNALANSGSLKPDEVAMLKRAISEGRLRPSQAASLQSQVSAKTLRDLGIADKSATTFAAGTNKIIDWSGRMLNAVDESNRVTAFLTAYRLAKAQPSVMQRAARLDGQAYDTPYDYARLVTDETNFRGGQEDRPLIQRFHPAAELLTQFQGPVFKLLELYARSAAQTVEGIKKSDPVMAKAAAIQFMALLAPQVMVAGVWSLPFADRLKELVEFIWKAAFGEAIDFEQELEKYIENGLVASAANFGLPHAYGALTLSSRMKIDPLPQGSVSDWDVFALLGPVGGLVQKPLEAYEAWRLGDYWGVAYALLPTSMANVVKGAQIELTGEQYTRRGGRVITPTQVQAAEENGLLLPPAARQAVGFAPPEFTDIRRAVNRQRELQQATRDPTERANIELSRFILRALEAQQAGRQAEAENFVRQYHARVAEIVREQRDKPLDQRIQINPSAIMDRARKDFLGRGSPEVLVPATRTPARPAAQEMLDRTLWRNQ